MSRFNKFEPLSGDPPAEPNPPRFVVKIVETTDRYLVKLKGRFLVVNRKGAATGFRDKAHATSAALTFGLGFGEFAVIEVAG